MSTANGLKFTEFKLAYHERRIPGVDARRANDPIFLEPDVERRGEGHRRDGLTRSRSGPGNLAPVARVEGAAGVARVDLVRRVRAGVGDAGVGSAGVRGAGVG